LNNFFFPAFLLFFKNKFLLQLLPSKRIRLSFMSSCLGIMYILLIFCCLQQRGENVGNATNDKRFKNEWGKIAKNSNFAEQI